VVRLFLLVVLVAVVVVLVLIIRTWGVTIGLVAVVLLVLLTMMRGVVVSSRVMGSFTRREIGVLPRQVIRAVLLRR
jgi:hypothetical protein